MKTTMKKIVLGAAAAAMAMSAIGITASAAEKHPGESGYCYYENQQAEVNCEDQPGIEDPDVLYGKHPGEAGYEYAVALLELVQGLPLELGTKAVDSFFANGYVKEDIFEEIMKYHESEKHPGECGYNYVNEYGKHPGECGYNYSEGEETNAQGKHPGESGYCYDANELGYDPSKYTEEQIRMIEASREVNGFVCGTLLIQFDEENAAKAKTEEKPQHATGLKVFGDVNCDGKVDVTDSVLLSRFVCEDPEAVLSEQGKINADIDGDGRLTMDDNTLLLNLIAKK